MHTILIINDKYKYLEALNLLTEKTNIILSHFEEYQNPLPYMKYPQSLDHFIIFEMLQLIRSFKYIITKLNIG